MEVKRVLGRKLTRGLMMAAALLASFCLVIAGGCAPEEDPFSPIESVLAIGYVDIYGAKVKAVAIGYDVDLTGADISADKYEIVLYNTPDYEYIGNGQVGQITAIYVNDKPEISETGGTGTGKYVVFEFFTDYYYPEERSFVNTMIVRVTQIADITLPNGDVIPKGNTESNNVIVTARETASGIRYDEKLAADGFVIPDIEGFRFYTDDPGDYGADGAAFVWENCFNQQDGKYYDEHLAYALYVPEDWSADKTYAMVTLENPAATAGTHPLVSVLETRGPAVFASEWAQTYVKEQHGVDGLIVVVPVVTERVNDNGGTPAEYEALVHLWDSIIEEYNVDTDYIYGVGQSVGGMVLLETNRNRDNFFAGMLLYEDQWAQNYYMDTLFIRDMVADERVAPTADMHYPRTDSYITWNYYLDENGNEITEGYDPYNYYYLISDDNILNLRLDDNYLCIDTWNELNYLYEDLVGATINQTIIDDDGNLEEQNALLEDFLYNNDNPLNINTVTFTNGIKGYSARRLDAVYEWLLSQSRQDEIARKKLDINKPFVAVPDADQIQTEERTLHFTDIDGNSLYFITAQAGSGTQFYNTCWLNLYTVADGVPGWLPDGMSWGKGVSGAYIEGVEAISDTAIAIRYDADMTGLVVNLLNDDIIGLDGNVREDIKIMLDPFELYDADGNKLNCTITNIYVHSAAETVSGAARQSGSGCYVIVEFGGSIEEAASVLQRTTLRTDTVFGNALPWGYEIGK